MSHSTPRVRQGFTLIELLLVIGIIAILASIVIVAINPTRQLGQARDAQRRSDVNTILNTIYQYSIDNNGTLPGYLTGAVVGTSYEVCGPTMLDQQTGGAPNPGCKLNATAAVGGPYQGVNIRALTGAYIVKVPVDPSRTPATATGTNHFVVKNANNRITVFARGAEQTPAGISVTR